MIKINSELGVDGSEAGKILQLLRTSPEPRRLPDPEAGRFLN